MNGGRERNLYMNYFITLDEFGLSLSLSPIKNKKHDTLSVCPTLLRQLKSNKLFPEYRKKNNTRITLKGGSIKQELYGYKAIATFTLSQTLQLKLWLFHCHWAHLHEMFIV